MPLSLFLDAAFAVFVDGLRQFGIDIDTATARASETFGLSVSEATAETPVVPSETDNDRALRELEAAMKGLTR